MAAYAVNKRAVAHARALIDGRQYVLDSDWGESQPSADDENKFLDSHTWDEYAAWHLGLTEGANDETKARYAFAFGDALAAQVTDPAPSVLVARAALDPPPTTSPRWYRRR